MRRKSLLVFLTTLMLSVSLSVNAQESANVPMNACVKKKQAWYTAVGGTVGAVVGYVASAFTGHKRAVPAAGGAAVGAGLGYLYARETAFDSCLEEHPEWKRVSQLNQSSVVGAHGQAVNVYDSARGQRQPVVVPGGYHTVQGQQLVYVEPGTRRIVPVMDLKPVQSSHMQTVGLGAQNSQSTDEVWIKAVHGKGVAPLGSRYLVTTEIGVTTESEAEHELILKSHLCINLPQANAPWGNVVCSGDVIEKRVAPNGIYTYRFDIPLPQYTDKAANLIGQRMIYEVAVVSVDGAMVDHQSHEFVIVGNNG